MKSKVTKLLALACVAALAMSVWAASASATQRNPRDPNSVKAAGKVSSISGNTFDLQTPRRGELKVQHDSATTWRNLSAGDLKVGARVAVIGKLTGDVLHADAVGAPSTKVRRHGQKKRAANLRLKGEVTAVGSSSFTLQARGRKVEVSYNDQTVFRGGSASDLKKGAKVGVIPVRPEDGSKALGESPNVTAKVIRFPGHQREGQSKRRTNAPVKAG